MAHKTIRDWTLTDTDGHDGPVLTLTKAGRAPLIVNYEPGMDREVLLEYATTRAFEAEIRDAGDDVPQALQADHDDHLETSRDKQFMRETARRRAERRAEKE